MEVEKTRYKKLLEVRNNYIRSLAQQGCSSEAIALLFSLSKPYINVLAKDYLSSNPTLYSTELLFNKREELIKRLKEKNYSDEDVSVIFYKGSLEKAEEATSEITLKEQNLALSSENKKLSKELTTYKFAFKELSEQKTKLESENKSLLNISEQKNSSLDSDLIIEKHNNQKLQEQISSLQLELEKLQNFKESASKYYIEQSEKESEQVKRIHILESKLQESQQENSRLKKSNQTLINENSQLQQLSSSFVYMQSDINAKLSIIESLESEIASLKLELEDENQSLDIDVSKSDRILYTTKEKRRMRTVYKACNYNRTKSLELLHSEGIMISYRHLGTIVSDMKPSKKK